MALSYTSTGRSGGLFPPRMHPSVVVGALAFALIVAGNAAYLGYQGGRNRSLSVQERNRCAEQDARYEQEMQDREVALACLLRQRLRAGKDPVIADVSPATAGAAPEDIVSSENARERCSVVITVRSSPWDKLGAGGRAALLRAWQDAWAPLCCSPSCCGRVTVRDETGAPRASLPIPSPPRSR